MRKEYIYTIGMALIVVVLITTAALFHYREEEPPSPSPSAVSETVTNGQETTEAVTKPPLTDELLILVNYNHEVPEDWTLNLVEIQDEAQMDSRAAGDFKEMMDAAREAGAEPYVRTAYRSKELQEIIFRDKVNEYINSGYDRETADQKAREWVAYPGTSEHQLGLCADIVDDHYHKLNEQQQETDTQKWLMAHSWEYGFILRYPTDKKEITHINYEPWHYRYVGRDNAKKIYESGLCLEEYLEANYDMQ